MDDLSQVSESLVGELRTKLAALRSLSPDLDLENTTDYALFRDLLAHIEHLRNEVERLREALEGLLAKVTEREPYWFHMKGDEQYYEAEVPVSLVERSRQALSLTPDTTDPQPITQEEED